MSTIARRFNTTLFFAALASTLVLASSHSHEHTRLDLGRRHRAVNVVERDNNYKRFDDARFTFFAPGTNACGGYDKSTDFIVALTATLDGQQWDNGAHCNEEITIMYDGKSVKAKITDECPGCPYGAIDLSPSLFESIVPGGFDQGVAYGSWQYGSGAAAAATTSQAPKSTSTTSKHSTTSHTSTSTTSTHHTTSSSTTSSSAATTTITTTTSTSSASAPTATVATVQSGNLDQFNLAIVQLANLVNAAYQVAA